MGDARAAVLEFFRAFEARDLPALACLFAQDDALVLHGTQANLHFTGWAAVEASFRRQFEALDAIRIDLDPETLQVRLMAGGAAACVAARPLRFSAIAGDDVVHVRDIRFMCAMERRDDGWRFVLMCMSLPQENVIVEH